MSDADLIRRHLVAVSTSAPALCQRVVESLLARLQDPTHLSLDPAIRGQTLSAVAWLKGSAGRLSAAFARHWQENMDQPSRVAAPTAARPLALLELKDLTLVDEDQAVRDIEISRVVQAVDLQAEWEWRELMGQIRALQRDPLGDGPLLADEHPASPAAVGRAFGQAVQELAPSAEARSGAMRAAAAVTAGELRVFYVQCSEQLRRWGATDAAYGAIVTAPTSAAATATGATPQAMNPGTGGTPTVSGVATVSGMTGFSGFTGFSGANSLPTTSGASVSGAAGLPTATAAAPPAPAEPVSLTFRSGIDRLASISRQDDAPSTHGADLQRLTELLSSVPPGATLAPSPTEANRGAAEGQHAVVQGLFEQITRDARLDRQVRRSIARLEQVVTRLAEVDPTLLTNDDHPTWALINRIAAHASDHPAAHDPVGTDFMGFVEPVVERLAQGGDRRDFESALADVQAYIADDEARQEARTAPAREALRRVDQEKELIPLLRQQVDIQLAKAPAISQTLHTFLTGPWTEILARAMAVQGDESAETQALVGTVDELLASLQVPANDADRLRIMRRLPELIERVQQGMSLIDLPQPHRERVLNDLMGAHRRVLFTTPPSKASDEPRGGGPDTDVDWQPSDVSLTDRLLDGPPSSEGSDTRPSATWTGGESNVGHLPTVPMVLDGQEAAQTLARWMDGLRPGTRCKLFLQGQWTTARMVWRSDNGRFFMFTSPLAGGAHSMTRRALERLRAEGLATELAESSAVQRAISGLKRQWQGR